MDAVAELGVPEAPSLFPQSFALRRVSPLEFNQGTDRSAYESVPIYHQPVNRGGSIGYGGVYPIDFGGTDEHLQQAQDDDEDHDDGGFGGFTYDDYSDYSSGGQQGKAPGGGGLEDYG